MSREFSERNEEKKIVMENGTGAMDIPRLIDDAVKGLLRFWPAFLVLISVCSSLFYFQAKQSYEPKYRSSATFIVNTNTALNYSNSYYNNATAWQIARSFPYIISNNALQHIIAEDLGVTEIPGEITAAAVEDTSMITISVTSEDPEDAYHILQSVLKNYPKVAKAVIGETELNVINETGLVTTPINEMRAQSAARMGLLLGLAVSGAWIALYVMTKRTIYREEDFKKLLNVKCLGSIPMVKFKKRSRTDKNLILIDNKRVSYNFVEATRTIRTRIEKDALEEGAQVYMVSSAIAREGKSTVASNLALSLTAKGKKVLLVDLDLRNPSVARTLGIETNGKGVVDVLMDEASLNEIAIRYKDTELIVLPGGHPIQTTAKVLQEENLEWIFQELRKENEYIIVDTPPSGLMTDAAQLVKHMDAGIFVVRQDYASIDRILDGVELLTDTGLRLAGCLLSYAESGIASHSYGYGRYGSYGKYGKYGKYESKYSQQSTRKEERQDET